MVIKMIKNYCQRKEAQKAEQKGEYYDALQLYSELHDKSNAARIYNKMKSESLDCDGHEIARILYDAGLHDKAEEIVEKIDPYEPWLDSSLSRVLSLDIDDTCKVLELYQKLGLENKIDPLKVTIAREVTCPDIRCLRAAGFTDKELEEIVKGAEGEANSLYELSYVGKAYLDLGMRGKARKIADILLNSYDGDKAIEIFRGLRDKEKVRECWKYRCYDYSSDPENEKFLVKRKEAEKRLFEKNTSDEEAGDEEMQDEK